MPITALLLIYDGNLKFIDLSKYCFTMRTCELTNIQYILDFCLFR